MANCVYKITCGDIVYVGATTNRVLRFKNHKNALSNNSHINELLQRAYNREHCCFFEVIEDNIPNELLSDREQYWMKNVEGCCNSNGTVYGSVAKRRHTKKTCNCLTCAHCIKVIRHKTYTIHCKLKPSKKDKTGFRKTCSTYWCANKKEGAIRVIIDNSPKIQPSCFKHLRVIGLNGEEIPTMKKLF